MCQLLCTLKSVYWFIYIVYREFHWITRKESLTKLTQEHCDNIRDSRIAVYRKELEAEKVKFAEEKKRLQVWIAEEERACGVVTTLTHVKSSETAKR